MLQDLRALGFSIATLLLAACSSSSGAGANATPTDGDTNDAPSVDAPAIETGDDVADANDANDASTTGYQVAYVADAAGLHVGKSHFQLKLTNADGTPATGRASSIVLQPTMVMPMMSHGNPVPIDAVSESATPGTYDCTLFFTMASVDASGNPTGQWKLKVSVGSAIAGTLDLVVSPPATTDTPDVMLKNAADTFTSGTTTKMRSWPMFRDTLVATTGGHEFGVFLATIQEGMMTWPPVTVGLELVSTTGAVQLTVQSLALEASTDGTTWTPMTCDATARCKATVGGLASGVAGKIFVKMNVDGRDYTTDGNAPDSTKNNGFATFAVTPS